MVCVEWTNVERMCLRGCRVEKQSRETKSEVGSQAKGVAASLGVGHAALAPKHMKTRLTQPPLSLLPTTSSDLSVYSTLLQPFLASTCAWHNIIHQETLLNTARPLFQLISLHFRHPVIFSHVSRRRYHALRDRLRSWHSCSRPRLRIRTVCQLTFRHRTALHLDRPPLPPPMTAIFLSSIVILREPPY